MKHYKENDIRAGDPNEGTWHLAHYPLPSSLGGQQTVALLAEHHAVQGVLQSEEFQCVCVSGLFDQWLRNTEWEPLYLKWLSQHGRNNQPKTVEAFMKKPKDERSARGRKAWATFDARGGDRSARNSHPERRKRIEIITPEGKIEVYESPKEVVERYPEIRYGKLCEVARGSRKHHRQFRARYV